MRLFISPPKRTTRGLLYFRKRVDELQISSNTYFTYDGHQSYLYGLRFAWIEDSPEKNLVSEKKYSQIKNNSQNYFRVAKATHDEALEFDAEIVADRVLIDAEVRRIYSKFFDKNQYKTLCLPVDGEDIYFNCIMTDIEKIEGGLVDKSGVVGFKLKILCDAPWGWVDKGTFQPEIDDEGKFIIRNRTDGQDYIYPVVTIEVPAAEDASAGSRIESAYSCLACPLISQCRELSPNYPIYMEDDEIAQYAFDSNNVPKKVMIINTSDTELRGTCIFCKAGESQTITMDPKTGVINGTNGDSNERESKVAWTNKKFIRLLPGDNVFHTENLKLDGDDPDKRRITMSFKEARILV